MKKIFIYITIILLALTSCNGFLDITPDGQQKRNDMMKTQEGIEDAMYGVYATMRSSSLYGRELSISSLEIMAQTLYVDDKNGSITNLHNYNYTYSGVQDNFESIWTKMYNNISNINSVLTSDLIANASAYPYTLYKGEALGLRAFMHFDLIRIFGANYRAESDSLGIPYATEFSLETPKFESVEKNYRHIIADLRQADQLLEGCEDKLSEDGGNYARDQKIHFNRWAVEAELARVYLNMSKYDSAYYFADRVIEYSGCKLNTKTQIKGDVAGKLAATECIFGIYYSSFYSTVNATLQQMTSFYSLNPRDDVEDTYKDGTGGGQDYRYNAWFSYEDNGGTSVMRLSKLTDPYEKNSNTGNRPSADILGINMIRLPEMYYIAAECLLNNGDTDGARDYFDKVLESRGLIPLSQRSPVEEVSLDQIDQERYKEFIGEGQIWFNMKRRWQNISMFDGQSAVQASAAIYIVPIPDAEKEYNMSYYEK